MWPAAFQAASTDKMADREVTSPTGASDDQCLKPRIGRGQGSLTSFLPVTDGETEARAGDGVAREAGPGPELPYRGLGEGSAQWGPGSFLRDPRVAGGPGRAACRCGREEPTPGAQSLQRPTFKAPVGDSLWDMAPRRFFP